MGSKNRCHLGLQGQRLGAVSHGLLSGSPLVAHLGPGQSFRSRLVSCGPFLLLRWLDTARVSSWDSGLGLPGPNHGVSRAGSS